MEEVIHGFKEDAESWNEEDYWDNVTNFYDIKLYEVIPYIYQCMPDECDDACTDCKLDLIKRYLYMIV